MTKKLITMLTNVFKKNLKFYKMLKLSEILKGHKGETFFSIKHGMVTLRDTINDRCDFEIADNNLYLVFDSEFITKSGLAKIYPNSELFEKYPLDPIKAWEMWINKNDFSIEIWMAKDISGDTYLYTSEPKLDPEGEEWDIPLGYSCMELNNKIIWLNKGTKIKCKLIIDNK